MNNITHLASLPLLPFPTLSNTTNLTHHLDTILSNNPSSIQAILPIKAALRAQWVRESHEDWRFFYLSLLSQNMCRDKCAHSNWLLIAQTQKIGIPQVAASEGDTCDKDGKPITLPHCTPTTLQSSPQG